MTTVTPTTDTPAPATSLQGVVRLDDWGVIAAQGEDAASFLHGQLTQDLLLQRADEARLVAYCNPKGRMLFTAIAVQRDGQILLCAPRERIAPTVKRLAMFVLRAKVRLADASEQWALWGAAGDAVPAALPSPWWAVWRDGERLWVRLPAGAGVSRALLVQPADLAAPAGGALDPAHWRWLDVMSGVAHVTDPVVEAFVPQMLNYESVGGVNFKKGCYPGQEVVARSQFRGTLKRRAYIAHAAAEVAVGAEVFNTADLEQPCGTVVQVAPAPGGGFDTIVSLQISAAQAGSLQVGAAGGVALSLQPLPYPLLEDI